MIIRLVPGLDAAARTLVKDRLAALGLASTPVEAGGASYLVTVGPHVHDIRRIGSLPGVADVHRVTDPYKLVSRQWRVRPTTIDLGDGVTVGEGRLSLALGPCSVETEEQTEAVARFVASRGVRLLRGGAYKPRSSPYSFQGLGEEGLAILSSAARRHGLKVVSEVMDASHIDGAEPFVDVFQVGTRNHQNYSLLSALGRSGKPVLLKRGMSGTLEELLQSAEYVFSHGNEKIILCERGIRTFEKAYRNTLDLNSVPVLKEKTHLPVFVDPSHGIGIRRHVSPVALAAVTAGADGLLVEVHEKPEEAASDGDQTLGFVEAERLVARAREVYEMRLRWESAAADHLP